MKRHWERLAEKIDALALRERGLVFFSLAFVVLALLYSTLVRPTIDQQRLITRNLAQQESQVRVMNQQLGTLITGRSQDPDAANRKRLDDLKRRILETQQGLAQRQATLVAADRMAGLLEDLVSRNRKLELVDLKSLAPVRIGAKEAEAKPAQAPQVRSDERGIFRHGVELTLQGSYFDLLDYVRELERLPTQLLWGKLDLSVGEYPKVTMKLTLYTLSLDRAWLVV
jgi:MSHA biogenesis protein MshJ